MAAIATHSGSRTGAWREARAYTHAGGNASRSESSRLRLHTRRCDLRSFKSHFIQCLAHEAGRFRFLDEVAHIAERSWLALGHADSCARIEKCVVENPRAGNLADQTGQGL